MSDYVVALLLCPGDVVYEARMTHAGISGDPQRNEGAGEGESVEGSEDYSKSC